MTDATFKEYHELKNRGRVSVAAFSFLAIYGINGLAKANYVLRNLYMM